MVRNTISQKPQLELRLPTADILIMAGCVLLVVMGTLPVLFSFGPPPSFKLLLEMPGLRFAGKCLTVFCLLATVLLISRLDSTQIPNKFFLYGGFLLLAFLLTDMHYYITDRRPISPDRPGIEWQADQYVEIITGKASAPHQYRFLPQGILWWILLVNGDFVFSYFIYRLFFTFAICLALYKLSRLYNSHKDSLVVVLIYAVFYSLSIRYYYGNLLDPLFHSAFIAALMYCQKRNFLILFLVLTLGMFVKETIILVVPCYYLLNMETLRLWDRKVILKLVCLTGWCLLLFALCRVPFQFNYDLETLNGTKQLMILSNLGFQGGLAKSEVPLWPRYFHPLVFIFIWLPILIYYRKLISRSLFYTSMYLAATIYLTNLCFGWNYESRNFIPAFCILVISTVAIFNKKNSKNLP